jgi:hypothetical protein
VAFAVRPGEAAQFPARLPLQVSRIVLPRASAVIESMSHLEPHEVAAFIDRTLDPVARTAVEAHLADCPECRAEVLSVAPIAGPPPIARGRPARRVLPWLLAAAALLVVSTRLPRAPATHREAAVRSAVAPRAIAPLGEVEAMAQLTWSAVPGADRYHVSLFDHEGRLLWEVAVRDTTATPPPEVAASIAGPATYLWSVKARVGWERWTESGLTEFRLRGTGAQ